MACPGGCVCGGGQPFAATNDQNQRVKGIYESDRLLSIRRSEENPLIKSVYKDIIGDRAHELLHVDYTAKNI